MVHLRYMLDVANLECSEFRHALIVMNELGIKYTHKTPQTMGEQWWFWNCENIPFPLPKFITTLDLDPIKQIGYGLSQSEAEEIKRLESLSDEDKS